MNLKNRKGFDIYILSLTSVITYMFSHNLVRIKIDSGNSLPLKNQ